jgi:hypothetical protein
VVVAGIVNVGYLFVSLVTVFVIVVVVFTRSCNLLGDVIVVFMCVCNVFVGVWFSVVGACLRAGVFANFVVLAMVVFVARGATSFLVVYQKTSACDQGFNQQVFLLLCSRFWMYLISKKRLLCHHGQICLFH